MSIMTNLWYPVRLERTAAHRLPSKYAVLQKYYQDNSGQLEETIRIFCEANDAGSLGIVFNQEAEKRIDHHVGGYGVSYQPPIDKLWVETLKEGRVFYHVVSMKTKQRWDFERAVFDEWLRRQT